MRAPPRVEVERVGVGRSACERRAAERADGFADAERKFSEPPAAHDEARARVSAYIGEFDAQLATELDDRPGGEQRVRRTFRYPVLRTDGLNQPARARSLFKQSDFVALLVERVGREHPGNARPNDCRLAPRLV